MALEIERQGSTHNSWMTLSNRTTANNRLPIAAAEINPRITKRRRLSQLAIVSWDTPLGRGYASFVVDAGMTGVVVLVVVFVGRPSSEGVDEAGSPRSALPLGVLGGMMLVRLAERWREGGEGAVWVTALPVNVNATSVVAASHLQLDVGIPCNFIPRQR